jgi:hypothetical protein
MEIKVGRNEPCPCGSGKKYKHCCMRDDEDRARFASHRSDDQVMELMLRQTSFSSKAELDAAMSRYHDYCEGLPDDAPIPTFMEYLGRANAATDAQRGIVSDLKEREFSDEEELESYLSSRMEAINEAPVGDFEGLSPEQMGRILHETFEDNADLVVLNPGLSDDVPLESELVATMRFILEYLVDHGGKSRLTARENLPQDLCKRYLERFDPAFPVDRSVPSEVQLPILNIAHGVLVGAGYIEESPTQTWMTAAGAELFTAGAWSRAFADAFLEALYYVDWQEQFSFYQPQVDLQFFQHAGLFLLYLLSRHPGGTVGEFFNRFCRAFPVFVEPIAEDSESMAIIGRDFSQLFFDGFCRSLGLTTLEEPAGTYDWAPGTTYETTDLFRRALVWKRKQGDL